MDASIHLLSDCVKVCHAFECLNFGRPHLAAHKMSNLGDANLVRNLCNNFPIGCIGIALSKAVPRSERCAFSPCYCRTFLATILHWHPTAQHDQLDSKG
jgi:hypothetical protein